MVVMKHLLIAAIAGTAIVFTVPSVSAQGGPDRPGGPRKMGPPPWGANLSPDEAQRLAAARDKVKDNPTIKSLRESRKALDEQLEKAMDAAILSADPSLGPVIEKVKQARDKAEGMRERFEALTPEQKQQLKAAREAAEKDPTVVAARQKVEAATTPEAKHEARRAMHEAMKAAILKQNPSLAPLLDKIGPKHMGPGGPGGKHGGPGGHDGPPPPPGGEDENE